MSTDTTKVTEPSKPEQDRGVAKDTIPERQDTTSTILHRRKRKRPLRNATMEDWDEDEVVVCFDNDEDDNDIEIVSLLGTANGRTNTTETKKKPHNRQCNPVFVGLLFVVLILGVRMRQLSSSSPDAPAVATIAKNETHNAYEDATPYHTESTDDETSDSFRLYTGNDRVDTAYQLAMDELRQNIAHADGSSYFIAGSGWDQLWTRDTAYAIELAGGLVRPEVSRHSLATCTEEWNGKTVWYQDRCGHFGGWPNLTDAIVGARGAWHLYLFTGNSTFLEWAYETTVNSLMRAEREAMGDDGVFKDRLFGGCSSFMESNSGYPKEYKLNGTKVANTKALSTNILYYNGYYYAYQMGKLLMEHSETVNTLKDRAKLLKKTIRNRLWMENKGLYAYFEDEDGELVPQTEGLGVSLAMLSDEFETEHRARMILKKTHRTEIGIPSLWPRFDLGDFPNDDDNHISQRYHNGRIWPFVSGYFAIAAARYGRLEIFTHEMARLIDLSEQESTFAEFYELDKSFPKKRKRQLWSDAGYLGMVYKGIFGMVFQPDGIEFSPNKDSGKETGFELNETISLLNVNYRRATLDIYVTGVGNHVILFKLNGEVQEAPRMGAYVTGRQLIEIEVAPSN